MYGAVVVSAADFVSAVVVVVNAVVVVVVNAVVVKFTVFFINLAGGRQ